METTIHTRTMSWRHSTYVAVGGILIALLVEFLLTLLPKDEAIVALAVIVGALGGVYFGIALSPTGVKNTVMNIGVSLFMWALALLGAWVSPMFFALAFFAHAGWDIIIGHPRALNEPVAPWYVPICVGADIILGVFIVVWFF